MLYEKPPVLLFSNPTFHDGINLTVRRGTKWNNVRKALIHLGGEYNTYVSNMHTKVFKFKDLKDSDLIHEHDPICKTTEGLFKVLEELYPGFSEDDEVTLIHFILNYHAPELGDTAYTIGFAYDEDLGKLVDVIPLNDDFYEIHSYDPISDQGRMKIVHASHWCPKKGWYMG